MSVPGGGGGASPTSSASSCGMVEHCETLAPEAPSLRVRGGNRMSAALSFMGPGNLRARGEPRMVHAEAASQGYDAARNGPQSESSRHGGAVVRGAPDSECGLTPAFRPAEKAVITSKADMFSRKADGSLTVQIPAPGED